MVAGKSPDWLPAGWTEHVKVKDSRKYKFYLDPLTGRKFYSKPQVNEYLISQQKNMDTVSPNMGDLTTGGKTSPNLEASQSRTRSSSKQNQMGVKQSVEKPNTGELTGGMTSLKQEEPQQVKTPKRTSRKSVPKQMNSSVQPVEKVVIERATPDGLPPGWLKEQLQYYTDPVSGYVFFSQEDVSRYLESGDINSCTIRPKKRDELGFLNQETSVSGRLAPKRRDL